MGQAVPLVVTPAWSRWRGNTEFWKCSLAVNIANVLATKSGLSDAAVLEAFSHFLDLDIETYSLGPEELRSALEFARRYGITIYDSSYLALALALGTRLLTADVRLARRAASLKAIDFV